jgi:hypothetical protein
MARRSWTRTSVLSLRKERYVYGGQSSLHSMDGQDTCFAFILRVECACLHRAIGGLTRFRNKRIHYKSIPWRPLPSVKKIMLNLSYTLRSSDQSTALHLPILPCSPYRFSSVALAGASGRSRARGYRTTTYFSCLRWIL